MAPGPTDDLALERQLCFALAVAHRSVLAVYRPLLEPLGLTHPQYLVMLALWEHAPLPAGRLAALLQQEPATLTPLLRRLEVAGLLSRTRRTDDERVLEIDVTAAGRALRERARGVPPSVVQRLGVPRRELEDLHAALTRVNAAARQADQDGSTEGGDGRGSSAQGSRAQGRGSSDHG